MTLSEACMCSAPPHTKGRAFCRHRTKPNPRRPDPDTCTVEEATEWVREAFNWRTDEEGQRLYYTPATGVWDILEVTVERWMVRGQGRKVMGDERHVDAMNKAGL